MRYFPSTRICLSAALLAACSAALADPPVGPPPARREEAPERSDDALSDSVRRVERSTRAQVLSAERVPFDGRDVNRIKTIDKHGRIRIFIDDPSRAFDEPARRPDMPARPWPLRRGPLIPLAPTRGHDD